MGYLVRMPQVELEMDGGTVTRWTVAEGDAVERGAVVAEVEAGKTAAEIEARETGVLRRIYRNEGETVPPGGVLGILAGADESLVPLESMAERERQDEADSSDAAASALDDAAADTSRSSPDRSSSDQSPLDRSSLTTETEESTAPRLPERHVSAALDTDLSGTIVAGSFDYAFDVSPKFGGGDAPTPVDIFLGAFAACLSASIGVQADIRGVDFDDITVDADATPGDGSVESIALHVTVVLSDDADTDDDVIERLVTNGERTCHVAEMLRDGLPVEVTWERE